MNHIAPRSGKDIRKLEEFFLEYHHIENRQKRAGKDRELHTWCIEGFECEVNEMAAMSEESSSLKPGGAGGRKKLTVTFM
jgi:hypothetical protein